MPITDFQREVIGLIAANRDELSHFAGGLVLHAAPDSARFSHDFDIFHEAAEDVARSSDADVATLRGAGFEVTPTVGDWEKPGTFRKAIVKRGTQSVEIDWAADSAFRFFPVEKDPLLGWRLHLFDFATNKALALCARSETRDYVDIIELGRIYPLPAIVWAACGKDPGFSPLSLLGMMRRFARIDPLKLHEIQARHLDPIALKHAWVEMSEEADAKITHLADTQPDTPIGVSFVDTNGHLGWPGDTSGLTIHRPSIRGCLPRVDGLEPEIPREL
jgi:hypothetical protein